MYLCQEKRLVNNANILINLLKIDLQLQEIMGASLEKCREIVANAEDVIAIELLCAQAINLFTNMKAGDGTLAAYEVIRSKAGYMKEDRLLTKDIAAVKELLLSGSIVKAVENKVGKLY